MVLYIVKMCFFFLYLFIICLEGPVFQTLCGIFAYWISYWNISYVLGLCI